MKRWDYTHKSIANHRLDHNKKDTYTLPEDCIWIEDPMWYDGIYMYQDEAWNRYSTRAYKPLKKDEMCRYWYIYKVRLIIDWKWTYDYHYEIISRREDI